MNQTTQKPIQTLQELAQNLRTDCYYFVSPCSAGDTYRLCLMKPALEQKYKGKIIFIIKAMHEAVCEMFENLEYVICDDKSVDFCAYTQCLTLDNVVSMPALGKIYSHFTYYALCIFANNQLDFDRLRLMLPQNAQRVLPTRLPKIDKNLQARLNKIAPLNKIILLCPEANSYPRLPFVIFKYECERLRKQGYSVIVNALKHEQEWARFFIDGVYDLNLSLKETIALALSCAGVISVRSGFCDIIAPHCNSLTIHYTKFENYIIWDNYTPFKIDRLYTYDLAIYKHFLRATRNLGEFSLPLKLYKRYIAKGFLRRVRTPFTLYFKIYLGHKKDEMKKSSPKSKVATNQAAQNHSELAQEFKNSSNQNLPNQTLNDKEMREFMKDFVQNELSQTYEFRLGLLLQKACERFWCGGFLAFPFAYLKLRKKKRHLQRISDIIGENLIIPHT